MGILMSRALLLRSLFLALFAFAFAAVAGAEPAVPASEDRYVDRTLGFSFSKPRFSPSDVPGVTTVAVTLSGATDGSFAPNINVVVQNLETSIAAYREQQLQEMKAAGWQVIEQTPQQAGGRPSLRTHARGSVQGVEIEFLAVAVTRDQKKLFVLTCTATTAQFRRYQAEFARVASSFVLAP
jgi:hypothetical protein